MTGMPEFTVWWFGQDGRSHIEARFVTAEVAFDRSITLSRSAAAKLDLISRIVVSDGTSNRVFEWRHGKGIVFPEKLDQPCA
jgi:hypothetical protein